MKKLLFIYLIYLFFSSYLIGNVSSDSFDYFYIANHFANNLNFITINPFSLNYEFETLWPIGYPVLIGLIERLTCFKIDAFWASKFINFLSFCFILLILKKRFPIKHNIINYRYLSFILFFSEIFTIFLYSWTEPLFIGILTFLIFTIEQQINNLKNRNFNIKFILSLLVFILPIFIRYAAIFIPIYLFSLLISLFIKHKKINKNILLMFVCSVLGIISYFGINFYYTGKLKAGASIHQPLNLNIFLLFIKSIIIELNLFVADLSQINHNSIIFLITFFVSVGILFGGLLKLFQNKTLTIFTYEKLLLSFGVFYLLFISILRFTIFFDGFGFRIFAPGTFFIFLALTSIAYNNIKEKKYVVYSLYIIAIGSLIINAFSVMQKYKDEKMSYIQKNLLIKEKYSNIPENSIIAYGNEKIKYLFNNIYPGYPKFGLNYCLDEDSTSFIKKVKNSKFKHVFIKINDKIIKLR